MHAPFVDNVSDDVEETGDAVETVVKTTNTTVTAQLETLTLALIILGVWVLLGPV